MKINQQSSQGKALFASTLITLGVLILLGCSQNALAQSPPTGPAGGDLSGTYPNPVLAVDRVRKVGDTMTGQLNITLPNAGGLVYPFSLSSSGNAGPNRGIGFQFNLPANPSAVLGAEMIVAREAFSLNSYFSFSTHNGTAVAEALRIAGSGNVGIGTASPLHKLDVAGNVTIGSGFNSATSVPANGLIVEGSVGIGTATPGGALTVAGLAPRITIQDTTGGGSHFALISRSNRLDIATQGLINIISALASGSVGVGTVTPGYRFDVQGGQINASGGLCIAGDCKTAWSQVGGGGWTQSGANTYYSSGNVGIGTTSPSYPLTIVKNYNGATGAFVFNTTDGASAQASGGVSRTTDFSSKYITYGVTAPSFSSPGYGETAYFHAAGVPIKFGTTSANDLYFFTNGITNTRMTVSSAGNVGIGTANPGSPLEIYANQNAVVRLLGLNNPSSGGNAQATFSFYEGATEKAKFATNSSGATSYLGGINALQIWNFSNAPTVFGTNSAERMRIAADGKVGIGTASPQRQLHLHSTANTVFQITDNTSGSTSADGFQLLQAGLNSYFENQEAGSMIFRTSATDRVWINSTGNVGIGTASPSAKLDIAGTVNATGLTVNGTPVTSSQWATSGTTINYTTGNVGIGTTSPSTKLDVSGTVNATGLTVNGAPVTSSQWATSGSTINYAAGNVGIGTTSPSTKLDVSGTVNATGLTVNGTPVTSSQWATSGGNINYASGNVGIGIGAPTEKLHVVGNGKVTGNLTVDGNIAAKYQDLAEWVPAAHALPAGTVTVLDPSQSNQVMASAQAYDTRVAGVISAQPGIVLGEAGTNKVLVATTGRVRVKVDATRGPIRIGDLLVTSDIEGLAMKSEPLSLGGVAIHRPGTLIGKALEPLEKGRGEILVLLSLQ